MIGTYQRAYIGFSCDPHVENRAGSSTGKRKKNLQISAAVQRGEAVQIFLFWINLTLVLVHPRSHFWPQEIPRAFYISILQVFKKHNNIVMCCAEEEKKRKKRISVAGKAWPQVSPSPFPAALFRSHVTPPLDTCPPRHPTNRRVEVQKELRRGPHHPPCGQCYVRCQSIPGHKFILKFCLLFFFTSRPVWLSRVKIRVQSDVQSLANLH